MARAALLWKPTKRTTPDDWASRNRVYPPSAGIPGPRNPYLTPYAVAFGRVVAAAQHRRAVLVCGAQMGKTDTALDIIGERLDTRPAPILYVGPSKEFNTDQFEPRLSALFSEAKTLSAKVSRTIREKKTLKHVAGVRVRLAHAGSSTALKSDAAALAIVDEYDEMLANVKGQGDPLGLAEARGFTYADFTTAITSTPSTGAVDMEVDPNSGLELWKKAPPEDLTSPIWKLFQEGTMHHYAWPCPECETYFVPRSKYLRWPRGASPARARRETYLECPHCKAELRDDVNGETKRWMYDRGVFVAPGQWIENGEVVGEPADTNTWSAWVSGLASPFRTWGERVEALVEAEDEGDPDKIQTATNAGFGELYAPGGASVPEWKEVLGLRGGYLKNTISREAVLITAGIDVQANRLVYTIRAWGARATSWLVDAGELWGETKEPKVWEDLEDLLDQRWEGLPVKIAFIDSGFRPGDPKVLPENMVYEFCRRNARFVFPTKGYATQRTPLLKSRIEVNFKGTADKYGLELYRLDSDYWKRWVHERIRWPRDAPGAWSVHDDVTEDYARQLVSEARLKTPSGKPQWIARSRENHFLDAEALAAAAGYLLNVQRINTGTTRPAVEEEEAREVAKAVASRVSPAGNATASRFAKMAARFQQRT